MYKLWTTDPESVHEAWDTYFKNIIFSDTSDVDVLYIASGASNKTEDNSKDPPNTETSEEKCNRTEAFNVSMIEIIEPYDFSRRLIETKQDKTTLTDCEHETNLFLLIRMYQNYGHFLARTDPLDYNRNDIFEKYRDAIEKKFEELKGKIPKDKKCVVPAVTDIGGESITLPFSEIIERYEEIYMGSLGIQIRQNNRIDIKKWIQKKIEHRTQNDEITPLEKKIALKRLINATLYDRFVTTTWPGEEIFALNGLESLIPALGQIVDTACSMGVNQIVISMEHHGRLNVIANVVKTPLRQIFAFYNNPKGSLSMGTVNNFLNLTSEKHITARILPSSSFVEYGGAGAMGQAKAITSKKKDLFGKSILPIIIHEDAAFAGQGAVYETVRLDQLPLYRPFGTMHVVLNDQMSTSAHSSSIRSTIYCTGVSFVNEAPVFHVNADDIENILYAAKLCAEIRQRFQHDAILDIVGYVRDRGNLKWVEPVMYSKISKMQPVLDKFYVQLHKEKIITEEDFEMLKENYFKRITDEFEKSTTHKPDEEHWLASPWKSFFQGIDPFVCDETGIHENTVYHAGKKLSVLPKKFDVHSKVIHSLQKRQELIKERTIDWVLAEGISFASLLKMGIPIRLCGNKAAVGAFHQRHHIIYHQTRDKVEFHPLSNVYPDQAEYSIINSPKSIHSTLAYEVGFSLTNPKCLCVWEATLGDYANLAQVVIDSSIASGEKKWRRQCGIVLLLPHGMEAEDSDNSNANPERFLCLSNDDPDMLPSVLTDEKFNMKQLHQINIIVANCTTPANYFHILRRQILLPFRKPLILFTPTSILKQALLRSPFEDIIYPTEFKRIISEFDESSSKESLTSVVKLIFCTGSIYYDLVDEREMRNLKEQISIIRIEQLSPFPYDLIKVELAKYKNVEQFAWVQEEHRNFGAWYYIEPRFEYLGVKNLQYIGRLSSAVTRVVYESRFLDQRNEYLIKAMEI